jgi:hypothetical protein
MDHESGLEKYAKKGGELLNRDLGPLANKLKKFRQIGTQLLQSVYAFVRDPEASNEIYDRLTVSAADLFSHTAEKILHSQTETETDSNQADLDLLQEKNQSATRAKIAAHELAYKTITESMKIAADPAELLILLNLNLANRVDQVATRAGKLMINTIGRGVDNAVEISLSVTSAPAFYFNYIAELLENNQPTSIISPKLHRIANVLHIPEDEITRLHGFTANLRQQAADLQQGLSSRDTARNNVQSSLTQKLTGFRRDPDSYLKNLD